MHAFYERIEKVFKDAGSSRYQFCKKYRHHYQTLQAYWNSDKLPSGKVLEDLAREYHVSLDALILGKEENPVITRNIRLLKQLDELNLLRLDAAIQMFQALDQTSRAPKRKNAEIVSERIEKALKVLEEMAKLIRASDMNAESKKAIEDLMNRAVLTIYEREMKDDWAELEEIE